MKISSFILFCFLLIGMYSCVEPYTPPQTVVNGLLVVDGHIYIEDKTCRIKLSRTTNLSSKETPSPETEAIVQVEDETGNVYPLTEKLPGYYYSEGNNFNYEVNYRLRIKTKSNKEYISEIVSTNKAPLIDSLIFEKGTENNWLVLLNAKDADNRNNFYRFDFIETWEYRSTYISYIELVKVGIFNTIINRRDNIYKCWATDSLKSILTYSTENFNENIISRFQLASIPISSNKLNFGYSINSRIYVISKQEYLYWEGLKQNSQNTGSIFDPQPSQIIGNIKSVNDKEDIILGYFSVYSTSTFRKTANNIFFNIAPSQDECEYNIRNIAINEIALPGMNNELFLDKNKNPAGEVIGYSVVNEQCADCRLNKLKGTNNKPSYMP